MKKAILCVCAIVLAGNLCIAQEFEKGTNVINLGIGLGGDFGSYRSSSQGLGIGASFERGMWDIAESGVVSLGGYLGTKSYKYNYSGGSNKWTYTIIGVRGAYHYTGFDIDNLDVYGGVMVSYNALSYKGLGAYGSRASATAFLGGRWYFTETFAAFAEVGYGVAYLTIGVSIRL